jgi:hypothetical protein
MADACFADTFGLSHAQVSTVFNLFIHFISRRWGYLIEDNMAFHLPYLPEYAQAIRNKCLEKGCFFPNSLEPDGFKIFGFVDNTMNATCRPGGGPMRDGKNAPRNKKRLQQAWYNGWKKLHGMKWQTVDLPNGLNFHVWGPISVGLNKQFGIYGDSAYIYVSDSHIFARHHHLKKNKRQILENRCMSTCREVIEWDYGDVGTLWSYLEFKNNLKIRGQYLPETFLTAMVLRNLFVTMNGGTTASHFKLAPPSFDVFIAAGPRP